LVKAAIEGRLPHGMGVVRLADLPAEWSRQHQMLGLPAPYLPFEPRLCRAVVSVSGKRDFQGGEKSPHRSPEPQINGLRDQVVVQKPRQIGASRTPSGNLHNCENAWWAREDSNLQPDGYEGSALT